MVNELMSRRAFGSDALLIAQGAVTWVGFALGALFGARRALETLGVA